MTAVCSATNTNVAEGADVDLTHVSLLCAAYLIVGYEKPPVKGGSSCARRALFQYITTYVEVRSVDRCGVTVPR